MQDAPRLVQICTRPTKRRAEVIYHAAPLPRVRRMTLEVNYDARFTRSRYTLIHICDNCVTAVAFPANEVTRSRIESVSLDGTGRLRRLLNAVSN